MRLTPEQTYIVQTTIREQAGSAARITVFGSRIDDTRRGGDLDLLVESTPVLDMIQRANIKHTLESRLNMPVDILAKEANVDPKPFQAIALATGIPL